MAGAERVTCVMKDTWPSPSQGKWEGHPRESKKDRKIEEILTVGKTKCSEVNEDAEVSKINHKGFSGNVRSMFFIQ